MGLLVDVKLVFEMEEWTRRLASEAARGGEGEMRGHKKIGESSVVTGRAGVFEDCAAIWSNPYETKDSGVDGWCGGAEVVDREVCLCSEQRPSETKTSGYRGQQ